LREREVKDKSATQGKRRRDIERAATLPLPRRRTSGLPFVVDADENSVRALAGFRSQFP
jgi:hypothetical protein